MVIVAVQVKKKAVAHDDTGTADLKDADDADAGGSDSNAAARQQQATPHVITPTTASRRPRSALTCTASGTLLLDGCVSVSHSHLVPLITYDQKSNQQTAVASILQTGAVQLCIRRSHGAACMWVAGMRLASSHGKGTVTNLEVQ